MVRGFQGILFFSYILVSAIKRKNAPSFKTLVADPNVVMIDEAETYSWYRAKQLGGDNSETIVSGASGLSYLAPARKTGFLAILAT